MNKTEITALSAADLAAKIDRMVALRPMANEYRTLDKDVKEALQGGAIQLNSDSCYETPQGNRAGLWQGVSAAWSLPRLLKALPKSLWETLLPRKPATRALEARIKACPEDKALAACRATKAGKITLRVYAKGENIPVSVEAENENE